MKFVIATKTQWIFLFAILFDPLTSNGLSYRNLEKLLITESNAKVLEETFYPINSRRKNIVSITYQFSWPDTSDDYLDDHPGVCYHWLSSPVHLTINRDILYGLSLRAYFPEISYATLQINLANESLSDISKIYDDLNQIDELLHNGTISTLCEGNTLLDILNNITANAHMYALGKKEIFDQEVLPNDRGYSVYYYTPNLPSKYCVIHHEEAYENQQYILMFGSLLAVVFTVFGFPFLFVELYKPVVKKIKSPSGSKYWRYITWSIVLVSFFVICLVLTNNALILKQFVGQYHTSSLDYQILIVLSIFAFGVWVLDFFGCVIAIAHLKNSEGGFPNDNNNGCCPQCMAIALGYTIIAFLLQLISFHVVYVMLGAIAAPSETLSAFCSFITAYIFAVIYVAIIFKYLNKNYFKNKEFSYFFLCILPLSIGGIALVVSIALFTTFFYKFAIAMEIMSRSEGLWGFVKSFLPAIFVAFLTFCGHKLLNLNQDSQVEGESVQSFQAEQRTDQDSHQLPDVPGQVSHAGQKIDLSSQPHDRSGQGSLAEQKNDLSLQPLHGGSGQGSHAAQETDQDSQAQCELSSHAGHKTDKSSQSRDGSRQDVPLKQRAIDYESQRGNRLSSNKRNKTYYLANRVEMTDKTKSS